MIKLLNSFLINTIYLFHNITTIIFKKHNYSIVNRSIEYMINHEKEYITSEPFWEQCSDEHDVDIDYYLIDKSHDQPIPDIPDAVEKIIIRIKYWYNNKIYKYITYNHKYIWPPHKSKSISFHVPLSSAQLLDHDDKPVKDVLEKIRRYAGPHSDFHGEKIKISDMLYYTESFLDTNFPKIKIRNYLGMSKTVNTVTGCINDLRLP
jgi:hypothetical protein